MHSAYNEATRNIQFLTYTENMVMYVRQIHSPWLGNVVESGETRQHYARVDFIPPVRNYEFGYCLYTA